MAQLTEVSLKANDIDKEFIREMIEEAMEKGDREVYIFASGVGTTVTIRPSDNHKPRWIAKGDSVPNYICSECGWPVRYPSSYCPDCGEKLAIAEEEQND